MYVQKEVLVSCLYKKVYLCTFVYLKILRVSVVVPSVISTILVEVLTMLVTLYILISS